MHSLPYELIQIIFENIYKITDKRQFLKTCVKYHDITKNLMSNSENNFSSINFKKINDYSMEKFTLELCHNKYFHLIPKHYIVNDNKILISALAIFNNIELLEIAKNNGCDLSNVCPFAALNNNLNVIKWGLQNGCELKSTIHIEYSKYVYTIGHTDYLLNYRKINVYLSAAYYGYLKVLNNIAINDWSIIDDICTAAILGKQINVLKWLHKTKYWSLYDLGNRIYNYAHKCNDKHIVSWINKIKK